MQERLSRITLSGLSAIRELPDAIVYLYWRFSEFPIAVPVGVPPDGRGDCPRMKGVARDRGGVDVLNGLRIRLRNKPDCCAVRMNTALSPKSRMRLLDLVSELHRKDPKAVHVRKRRH